MIYFILWAALLQGFFLALLYIFSKRNRSFANVLLGLFVLSVVFEAFKANLPLDAVGSYSIAEYFSLPEVKLFIPLLLFHFVLEKMGSSNRYALFLRANYFLALLISTITFYNLYLFVSESSSIVRNYDFSTVDSAHLWLQTYAFVITLFVFFLAFREILKYKRLVQDEFSDYNLLQIRWLWRFVFMLMPATLFWGAELFRVVVWPDRQPNLVLFILLGVALFLYYLSYQAYGQPNLFDQMPKSVLDTRGKSPETIRENNNCSEETSAKMQKLMTENQYYLDHDLTINTFARAIHMSPRLISTCINQNLGQNFNEWVNGFRVKKAQELLENDTGNLLSIEGIGQESGFKSRSALYAAFKNKLGFSPGEYRKSNVSTH